VLQNNKTVALKQRDPAVPRSKSFASNPTGHNITTERSPTHLTLY